MFLLASVTNKRNCLDHFYKQLSCQKLILTLSVMFRDRLIPSWQALVEDTLQANLYIKLRSKYQSLREETGIRKK